MTFVHQTKPGEGSLHGWSLDCIIKGLPTPLASLRSVHGNVLFQYGRSKYHQDQNLNVTPSSFFFFFVFSSPFSVRLPPSMRSATIETFARVLYKASCLQLYQSTTPPHLRANLSVCQFTTKLLNSNALLDLCNQKTGDWLTSLKFVHDQRCSWAAKIITSKRSRNRLRVNTKLLSDSW